MTTKHLFILGLEILTRKAYNLGGRNRRTIRDAEWRCY